MRDPALDADSADVWSQIAGLFVRGQSYTEFRLDRLDRNVATLQSDVAVLKSDVAVLKSDVGVLKSDVGVLKSDVADLKTGLAETNERLNRLEVSTERRFDRIDAKLEQLVVLIQRDETKRG